MSSEREPYAWAVSGSSRLYDEYEAEAEAKRCGGSTKAFPLYRRAAPEGWRPIETAPKDGTSFLGWVAAERWSSEDGGGSGRSHDESTCDFCWYVPERPDETGGYFTNAAGQIGDAQDITHWMPLLGAPKE